MGEIVSSVGITGAIFVVIVLGALLALLPKIIPQGGSAETFVAKAPEPKIARRSEGALTGELLAGYWCASVLHACSAAVALLPKIIPQGGSAETFVAKGPEPKTAQHSEGALTGKLDPGCVVHCAHAHTARASGAQLAQQRSASTRGGRCTQGARAPGCAAQQRLPDRPQNTCHLCKPDSAAGSA